MGKRPKLRILSSLLVAAALVALMVVPVLALDPTSPLSGTVKIDGVDAPVGTTVAVFVGTEITARATVVTTTAGHYEVVVTGTSSDVGKALSFKVNGLAAATSPASPTYANWAPQVVNLTAFSGAVPDISVAAALAFGNVNVGASSTKALTISNTGTASLTITGLSVTGTQFSATTPTTVPAGGSVNCSVTFTPTSTGAKTATLTISSNDPDEASMTVALSGTGTEAPEDECPSFTAWLNWWTD